jgi:hypothetical protein
MVTCYLRCAIDPHELAAERWFLSFERSFMRPVLGGASA